ncbi:MAG TPA: GGDEF domain-containing protein [Phycisphaerales bacterium]|mgnify:CR=1 FL=1|nr:GGDEF domain-containing protein [Phycisphaerales bacterium]HMP37568.1 GGDEF domain-containing protein [Phycisphaerales bacterium]
MTNTPNHPPAQHPADPPAPLPQPPSPALAEALFHGDGALIAAHLAPLAAIAAGAGLRFIRAPEERAAGERLATVTGAGTPIGHLASASLSPEALAAWAESLGAWLAAEARIRELDRLAHEDPLTGAGNRRDFDRFLAAALESARVRERALPLMVFDLDDFKRYNDRFGHAAGDEVLRETVALLRGVIRKGDRVFRIGGDEFVVVFADPTSPRSEGMAVIESVEQVARRFVDGVRSLDLPQLGEGGLGPITISAGLARFPDDGADPATLLAAADLRSLCGKRRGKDSITLGPADLPAEPAP